MLLSLARKTVPEWKITTKTCRKEKWSRAQLFSLNHSWVQAAAPGSKLRSGVLWLPQSQLCMCGRGIKVWGIFFSPSDEGPLYWITGLASLLQWMVSCSIQLWPEQNSSATAKHLLCPSRERNNQTKWNFFLVTKATYNRKLRENDTNFCFPISLFHFHNSYLKKYQLESIIFFP